MESKYAILLYFKPLAELYIIVNYDDFGIVDRPYEYLLRTHL